MNYQSLMRWFIFPRVVRPRRRPDALFWWEGELGPIWQHSPQGTDIKCHYVRLFNSMQTEARYLKVLHPRRRAGALVSMTGSRKIADDLVAYAIEHGHSKAEARALIHDIRSNIKRGIRDQRRTAAILARANYKEDCL